MFLAVDDCDKGIAATTDKCSGLARQGVRVDELKIFAETLDGRFQRPLGNLEQLLPHRGQVGQRGRQLRDGAECLQVGERILRGNGGGDLGERLQVERNTDGVLGQECFIGERRMGRQICIAIT
jgi:hypothetical protein